MLLLEEVGSRGVGGCREKEVTVMALSPFKGRGFYDVHGEMNRLFDEMFGGLARRSGGRQGEGTAESWSPALDVLHEDGDVLVRAELPGVKPDDVDITLSRGVLTISGQRKDEQEQQGQGYYVRERRYGSFRRSLVLPEGIDESKIDARYENGVLEVRIAGAAAVREPKKIQIQAAGGESFSNGHGEGSEGQTPGS